MWLLLKPIEWLLEWLFRGDDDVWSEWGETPDS
jgi:hypothetical protein